MDKPPADYRLTLRLDHKSLPIDHSLLVEPYRPSRFGTSRESFLLSAPLYRSGILSGVHLHNGSELNTSQFYQSALNNILWAAKQEGFPLGYVNLGGGFHSIPQSELAHLFNCLRDIAGETPIFIEPGHIMCRGAGFLLCKIHTIRSLGGERYQITVDASYDCHAKWSYPSWDGPKDIEVSKMPYQNLPEPEAGFQFIIFTGATCYEKDQLGIFRILQKGTSLPISPDDSILLSNINGYSFAWNTGFNGVPKARVKFS